jgi:hypothetical protein
MTDAGRDDEVREVAREVLRELVPGMLRDGAGQTNGAAPARRPPDNGATVVPQVPAPPVAAVLRPSTWDRPAAPGEIIGNSPAAPASPPSPRSESPRAMFQDSEFRPGVAPSASGPVSTVAPEPPVRGSGPGRAGEARLEVVAIDSSEDLDEFIRQLMRRLENPRERLAIRTGQLRFELRRSAATATAFASAGGASVPATRIEKGAVTERMVRTAAAEGTRLVLGTGAVLTPLAREQARARGVEISREPRC